MDLIAKYYTMRHTNIEFAIKNMNDYEKKSEAIQGGPVKKGTLVSDPATNPKTPPPEIKPKSK